MPKEEYSEQELVSQCLREDRGAQRALYNKYQRAMFSTAYRLVNDYDLANDALQDAFVEVFRSLKSFRGTSTLGAWIKTIVVRKAIQKFKGEHRFETYEENEEQLVTEWQDNLTGEMLDKAIRSLPAGYRAVFLLIEVEGYSHKEAAEILNISEGTSKSQLFHSKKILKEKLRELYEGK